MTTTYVFGAGASRHAGYPLASDMGQSLMDFMLNSQDIQGQAYAEYLVDNFGRPSNIEDLITELQSRIDALKDSTAADDKTEYRRLGTRLGYLGTSIREWFRQIHLNPATAYAEFSEKIIQPGDSVITFNYDDSLDRELKRARKWDVSQGYGFQLGAEPRSSEVLLLKLHGSMNWLVSVFGGATSGAGIFSISGRSSLGEHPVIHQADLEYLGYEEFSGHTYKSGGAFPCLILPGRTKRFYYDTSLGREYADFWSSLWSQAVETIQRTDRIVICGYSLLPVDQRACDLLLREPSKATNVSVVSGSQSERIAADFRDAGFRAVATFNEGYFENWVTREVNAHS